MSRAGLDSLALAQEKLEQAELMFFALERLLDNPACVDHARRLAALGGSTCQQAVAVLEEQEVSS
ncbi:hypothetical protein [Billgrantia desiderata]|uniref:hypothetical protein n=1 Tax=Billgrantia desiderata TaxID=52021 RepID=UPI003F30CEFA